MGTETSKALLARRRESTERISRLVATAEERNPATVARRQRITGGLRLARLRMRALSEAQMRAASIEVEIGQALMAVEAEGMSRNTVFERAGLPRHVGRKYVAAAMAAQDGHSGDSSTAGATGSAARPHDPDLDRRSGHREAAAEGSL